MQATDPKVIQYLNKALGNELIAINQYFLHSRMFEDWGLKRLAEKEYEESIDEMKHADILIERILVLKGEPNMEVGVLAVGKNVQEMLVNDYELEKKAIVSTIIGLVGGILLFPSPDFSKSLLVGIIFPSEFFPIFVSQSLLFCSFAIATFLPVVSWRLK